MQNKSIFIRVDGNDPVESKIGMSGGILAELQDLGVESYRQALIKRLDCISVVTFKNRNIGENLGKSLETV